MEKIVHIGKIEEQDEFRRASTRAMSPTERVNALLEMQYKYLRWDLNPKTERVGKLKRINFKDAT